MKAQIVLHCHACNKYSHVSFTLTLGPILLDLYYSVKVIAVTSSFRAQFVVLQRSQVSIDFFAKMKSLF